MLVFDGLDYVVIKSTKMYLPPMSFMMALWLVPLHGFSHCAAGEPSLWAVP